MEIAQAKIDEWRKQPNYQKKLLSFNIPSLGSMPDIPEECEELLFYNCGIIKFNKPFPPRLRVLVIRSCRNLIYVPTEFPESLEQLIIESCRFAEYIDKQNGHYHMYPSDDNRLTALPKHLTYLVLNQTGIVELPKHLPLTLTYMNLLETYLNDIPELPEGLQTLYVNDNEVLPYLPDSLERLYYNDFEQGFEDMDMEEDEIQEIHAERIQSANQAYEWPRSLKRSQERCSIVKEDLMAAAWNPNRVQKWLEAGDEVFDNITGADNYTF